MSAAKDAIVIKLGGSLTESRRIGKVVDIIVAAPRSCIVVPGGGAFADAVRRAQEALNFDDATAHRMAMLAMHQSGLTLAARHPRLAPADTPGAMRRAMEEGRIPVWMPEKMMARDRSVAADWSTTSDSLAARLAERMKLPLVLVKSCRVPKEATAKQLADAGIVDAAFAGIVCRSHIEWRVLGAGDKRALIDLLAIPRRSSRRSPSARAIARRR